MEGFELGRKGTDGGRKGRAHAIGRSLQACNALPNALVCQNTGSNPGQVMHFFGVLHDIHNAVQCQCQQQQHEHSHSNNSSGRSSSANIPYSRYMFVIEFMTLKTSSSERRLVSHVLHQRATFVSTVLEAAKATWGFCLVDCNKLNISYIGSNHHKHGQHVTSCKDIAPHAVMQTRLVCSSHILTDWGQLALWVIFRDYTRTYLNSFVSERICKKIKQNTKR